MTKIKVLRYGALEETISNLQCLVYDLASFSAADLHLHTDTLVHLLYQPFLHFHTFISTLTACTDCCRDIPCSCAAKGPFLYGRRRSHSPVSSPTRHWSLLIAVKLPSTLVTL